MLTRDIKCYKMQFIPKKKGRITCVSIKMALGKP